MQLTKPIPNPAVQKDDVERFFDRVLSRSLFGRPGPESATPWLPKLDFSETEKEFVVRLEVAGVPKDDLDVNLEGQVLTLSGRREAVREEETEDFFWKERDTGRFVRSLRLPSPVKAEDITARYHDGVLTVQLPKKEPVLKNRIAIS